MINIGKLFEINNQTWYTKSSLESKSKAYVLFVKISLKLDVSESLVKDLVHGLYKIIIGVKMVFWLNIEATSYWAD